MTRDERDRRLGEGAREEVLGQSTHDLFISHERQGALIVAVRDAIKAIETLSRGQKRWAMPEMPFPTHPVA